jgi:hypothetical protein
MGGVIYCQDGNVTSYGNTIVVHGGSKAGTYTLISYRLVGPNGFSCVCQNSQEAISIVVGLCGGRKF